MARPWSSIATVFSFVLFVPLAAALADENTRSPLDDTIDSRSATELLAAVCGQDQIDMRPDARGRVSLGCLQCPKFTSARGPRLTFTAATFGRFTAPNLDEALVDLAGCESPADAGGGTALVRRGNDHVWRRVSYAAGVRTYQCYRLEQGNARDLALCVADRTVGEDVRREFVLLRTRGDRVRTELVFSYLSRLTDTGCSQRRASYVTREDVDLRDANNDGRIDLVVQIDATTAALDERAGRCEPIRETRHTQHFELIYLFDGKYFWPAAGTEGDLQRLRDFGIIETGTGSRSGS